jgi:hypothetical protein
VLIPHFEEDGGVSNGSDRINITKFKNYAAFLQINFSERYLGSFVIKIWIKLLI